MKDPFLVRTMTYTTPSMALSSFSSPLLAKSSASLPGKTSAEKSKMPSLSLWALFLLGTASFSTVVMGVENSANEKGEDHSDNKKVDFDFFNNYCNEKEEGWDKALDELFGKSPIIFNFGDNITGIWDKIKKFYDISKYKENKEFKQFICFLNGKKFVKNETKKTPSVLRGIFKMAENLKIEISKNENIFCTFFDEITKERDYIDIIKKNNINKEDAEKLISLFSKKLKEVCTENGIDSWDDINTWTYNQWGDLEKKIKDNDTVSAQDIKNFIFGIPLETENGLDDTIKSIIDKLFEKENVKKMWEGFGITEKYLNDMMEKYRKLSDFKIKELEQKAIDLEISTTQHSGVKEHFENIKKNNSLKEAMITHRNFYKKINSILNKHEKDKASELAKKILKKDLTVFQNFQNFFYKLFGSLEQNFRDFKREDYIKNLSFKKKEESDIINMFTVNGEIHVKDCCKSITILQHDYSLNKIIEMMKIMELEELSIGALKKKYIELSRKLHPDKGKEIQEQFLKMKEARDILSEYLNKENATHPNSIFRSKNPTTNSILAIEEENPTTNSILAIEEENPTTNSILAIEEENPTTNSILSIEEEKPTTKTTPTTYTYTPTTYTPTPTTSWPYYSDHYYYSTYPQRKIETTTQEVKTQERDSLQKLTQSNGQNTSLESNNSPTKMVESQNFSKTSFYEDRSDKYPWEDIPYQEAPSLNKENFSRDIPYDSPKESSSTESSSTDSCALDKFYALKNLLLISGVSTGDNLESKIRDEGKRNRKGILNNRSSFAYNPKQDTWENTQNQDNIRDNTTEKLTSTPKETLTSTPTETLSSTQHFSEMKRAATELLENPLIAAMVEENPELRQYAESIDKKSHPLKTIEKVIKSQDRVKKTTGRNQVKHQKRSLEDSVELQSGDLENLFQDQENKKVGAQNRGQGKESKEGVTLKRRPRKENTFRTRPQTRAALAKKTTQRVPKSQENQRKNFSIEKQSIASLMQGISKELESVKKEWTVAKKRIARLKAQAAQGKDNKVALRRAMVAFKALSKKPASKVLLERDPEIKKVFDLHKRELERVNPTKGKTTLEKQELLAKTHEKEKAKGRSNSGTLGVKGKTSTTKGKTTLEKQELLAKTHEKGKAKGRSNSGTLGVKEKTRRADLGKTSTNGLPQRMNYAEGDRAKKRRSPRDLRE